MSSRTDAEYLRALLTISAHTDLAQVLDAALVAVMDRIGAHHGYVEIDAGNEGSDEPVLWRARNCTDDHVACIRDRVSKGILMEARLAGRTVTTDSAVLDPRFEDLGSVRQHEIGPVVCVPFDGFWGFGLLYLQCCAAGRFDANACEAAELAVAQLRLVIDARPPKLGACGGVKDEMDARTRQRVIDALQRHDWNVAAVARELNLSRRHISNLMRRRRKP